MEQNCELNYWLSKFIMEIRRQDGTDYPPNSLTNIISGIQRQLRENGRNVNFFKKEDNEFLRLRQSLDSRMKELTAAGVGVAKKRSDPVSNSDEDTLWDSVFSKDNSLSLSFAVFFYNCKLFGLRGMDVHRDLASEQLNVSNDGIGKYVSFSGRVSKNVQGGLDHRRVEPKFIKQYEEASNPRCVVRLYETYLALIPRIGPFYRRPIQSTSGLKYSSQTVGINTLGTYMKRMFADANINTTGRNITNHSGKVTCCTALYNAGFGDKAVMGRSGHRSNAVQLYKRESADMLKDISNKLQPPKPKAAGLVKTKSEPVKCENKENVFPEKSVDNKNILTISVPENISLIVIEKNGKKIKLENIHLE